jgi:hypothetical protein
VRLKEWMRWVVACVLATSCGALIASELWYHSLLPDDLPAAPAPAGPAWAREVVWMNCGDSGPPRLRRAWPPFLLGTLVPVVAEGLGSPSGTPDNGRACLALLAARLLDHRPPRRILRHHAEQMALVTWVERNWTAEQALDYVAANVWMGDGISGVPAASLSFFGRPVETLTIAEAALLGAVVRNPRPYDPRCHPERARDERDRTLARLHAEGVLTKGAYDAAIATEVVVIGDCSRPDRPQIGHDGVTRSR